jgi:7-cyano-7-deazaguanine synthase in queuosine biosynthesis
MPRAVVLLSGGLDSSTTLAHAKAAGYELYALSVDYGQRHWVELDRAAAVAKAVGVADHRVVTLDLRAIGGSALTADVDVPKDRTDDAIGHGVPVTYVPARNTILLGVALGYAETVGAFDLFIGANVLDFSVHGDTRIWLRNRSWARLMPIREAYQLPPDDYETVAVDPAALQAGWRRVTDRSRHWSGLKRCFTITLERGQSLTVTEDHSLFTLDPETAEVTPVRGCEVAVGMPLIAPFDLRSVADAWTTDLATLDLSDLPTACASRFVRRSIRQQGGAITNRLKKTHLPVAFPVEDDFLYLVGLWLAEGGKELESRSAVLALSIGGIPGAVERVADYLQRYGVKLLPSPANPYDFAIPSSVFATLFWHLGLFGTAKKGEKRFPPFYWRLSQRQRRVILAGWWDGDGSHVFHGQAVIAQKSHALIEDAYHTFLLDGLFPNVNDGPHGQRRLFFGRADDFATLVELYPFGHTSKLDSFRQHAGRDGRDKATGVWKCPGVWKAVSEAALPPGRKTVVYNTGGKYDNGLRSQRSAFADVPALRRLVESPLAFLQVERVEETGEQHMYDLSVEGAENFVANGVLAHNSGYPDCRPEFLEAFQVLANLATKAGTEGTGQFRVHAPLLKMTKADIIREAVKLGLDLGLTLSCYDPDADGKACGRCDSCILRKKGFAEAGVSDPTQYREPAA